MANINMPRNNIGYDRFGKFEHAARLAPETHGQIRIANAWKETQGALSALDELVEAIGKRGVYTDDTIMWYVYGYPDGNLAEDMMKWHKELGRKIKELREAMVTTGTYRKLWEGDGDDRR